MPMSVDLEFDYAVVGGGAAGVFSAIQYCIAASNGQRSERPTQPKVIVLEGSRRLLTKVKISGGGRCNVTHHEFETNHLIGNYPRGSKELKGPFSRFQPKDTVDFFESRGVKLKVEKDGRMFPVSDDSSSIIDCFKRELEKYKVGIRYGFILSSIEKLNSSTKDSFDGFLLCDKKGAQIKAKKVLLATGSNPGVWAIVKKLGHQIVDPVPSLFTFCCDDPLLENMAGTSFSEVECAIELEPSVVLSTKKEMNTQMKEGSHESTQKLNQILHQKRPRKTAEHLKSSGPLLITHWGLSGPAILKLSAFAARELHDVNYHAVLVCRFLVGLNRNEIYEKITEFSLKNSKKEVASQPVFSTLTKRFWQKLIEVAEFSARIKWGDVSNEMKMLLAYYLCSYRFSISGKGEFKEEFVTAGGIDLKDINMTTMESKKTRGLYFAGEITNVDGVTGGFNFQNAWTGGYISGRSACRDG